MDKNTRQSLFEKARQAAEKSYSPYSKFRVGAAILCKDGSVFTGTNVENRSFGLTICAERSALTAAISAGKTEFEAVVIATPDADYPVSPCGACRQVLSEFLGKDAEIDFGASADALQSSTMGELFPFDALHELGKRS
ncbi:MAG: cytidine deaminase [Spirochaetia bacterium]|nr:cytidine deaminase [Spirochaetia bacterium]